MVMFYRCYEENRYNSLCLVNKDQRSTVSNAVYLFMFQDLHIDME
jgi:hypothetical protein